MGNLKKNLGYQTIYQVLTTCLPLLTAPYLSRVLGAECLGIYSYTLSIVNYFTLFAMLGMANYGTRTIAMSGKNRREISQTFWEIYSLQCFTSIIALIFYYAMVRLVFPIEDFTVFLFQGLYLIACLADISWLFFGIEAFKVTVTRNIVVKLLTVLSIFVFVKSPEDLWKYTAIMSTGTLLSNAALWIYLPKIVDIHAWKHVSAKNIVRHIKPNIVLFVPLVATSVFHTTDKTMLGLMSTDEQSGFYYSSDKIINIPIGILNGIGTVMLPRMTALYQEKKTVEANSLFRTAIEAISCAASAMAFGIAAVANEFVPVFFGQGYEPCIELTIAFTPILIIKSLSMVSRMLYLVPQKLEKTYTQSVFASAIINVIVNAMLIPQIGAMGAVMGTLVAEIVCCVWQYSSISKRLNLRNAWVRSFVYIIWGFLMFFAVRLASKVFSNIFVCLIFEISVGAAVYIALCIIFWKISKNDLLKKVVQK